MARIQTLPASLLSRFKYEVEPSGTKNGTNVVFTTPDNFLEDTIRLYVRGQRWQRGAGCDYVVSESGGAGTGFDTITLLRTGPRSDDAFFVDYTVEG